MPHSSSTPLTHSTPAPQATPQTIPQLPTHPPTPTPIKPRFYPQDEPTPRPISQLPPLRPPSASFQALGADISWREISRSCTETSLQPDFACVTPSISSSPSLNLMPQPDRRRSASPAIAPQLISWLNRRSAPVVYAASIALGLLALGTLSRMDDRPSPGLSDTDCTGVILVDATLTPETFAQIPSNMGQAPVKATQLGSP